LDIGPSKTEPQGRIMLPMSTAAIPASQVRPTHTTGDPPTPVARRLVLVPASGRGDELVRRYRLARLRVETRETSGEQRFEHLRRTYD
jgi:hypothetical protein